MQLYRTWRVPDVYDAVREGVGETGGPEKKFFELIYPSKKDPAPRISNAYISTVGTPSGPMHPFSPIEGISPNTPPLFVYPSPSILYYPLPLSPTIGG